MILAEPGGGVTVLPQDLANGRAILVNDRIIARKTGRHFRDHTKADRVVVASGDQRGARG